MADFLFLLLSSLSGSNLPLLFSLGLDQCDKSVKPLRIEFVRELARVPILLEYRCELSQPLRLVIGVVLGIFGKLVHCLLILFVFFRIFGWVGLNFMLGLNFSNFLMGIQFICNFIYLIPCKLVRVKTTNIDRTMLLLKL